MNATLDTIADHLSAFRESIVGYESEWRDALAAIHALPTMGKRGTARDYFKALHGHRVNTIQITRNGRAWCPGVRTIDATRAGAVRLNDSIRGYAGLHVIATDGATLVVHDSSGFDAAIIFTTA